MNEIQNTNVRVGHREKALLSSLWDLAVSWGCDGWDHRVGRPDTLRPNCWERPIAPWAAADWSWQNSTRAKPSRAVSCCWWPWKKKNGKEHVNCKFHSTHTLPVITKTNTNGTRRQIIKRKTGYSFFFCRKRWSDMKRIQEEENGNHAVEYFNGIKRFLFIYLIY